jgi:hypothetical protein
MRPNPTLQRLLTDAELAERQAWFEGQRVAADALSAQLTLAQQQIRVAELEGRLVADTRLELSQLRAIREWLKHNA